MSTADKLNYTIEAKNNIRDACIAKGVGVPDSAPFGEYGKYILALPTGGAGGDNPKLHPPIISIYKSREIHIDDQSTNGCFSEKVDIQLNYVAFAEAIMENGHASIPFEKGAIQSGDELFAIVSAENFYDSSPTIKVLTRDDFVTYGDGSLNKVTNGYNNHIKINGIDIETSIINSNYFAGNINNENGWLDAFKNAEHSYNSYEAPLFNRTTGNYGTKQESTDGKVYQFWQRVYAGTTVYSDVCCDATKVDKTCRLEVQGGHFTTGIAIGAIKFNIDDLGLLTLKELVTNEIIEPLVLMWSGTTGGNYYFSDLFNIYDGGNTKGYYPFMHLYFILKKGHKINNLSMYSNTNTATSYADGLAFTAFDNDLFNIEYRD